MQSHAKVTVLVVEDPARLQGVRDEPRFFPKLPPGGGERRLPPFQLPAGEFPKSAQESRRRSTEDEPTAPAGYGDDRTHDEGLGPRRSPDRQNSRVRQFLPRPAVGRDRTPLTTGLYGEAHGLAEFHERLVEIAGA
ncbi:MAG: hypothetical protein WCB18_09675, partial [Thermoplasmata archaeon]